MTEGRRGVAVRLLLLVFAVLLVVPTAIVGTTATPAAASTVSGWHLSQSFALPVNPNGVSCPTPSTCIAVAENIYQGGDVFVTNDGGASYTTVPTTGWLRAISCASATTCVAVGPGNIGRTTDGGLHWALESEPYETVLTSVSCPSTTVCIGVGYNNYTQDPLAARSTDGGVSWQLVQSIYYTGPSNIEPNAVSCPTTEFCVATFTDFSNGVIESTDGGNTWSAVTITGVTNVAGPQTVSCPSSSVCYIGGEAGTYNDRVGFVVSTTDGGSTWTTPVTTTYPVSDLSCVSTTACEAVTQSANTSGPTTFALLASTDGGATWPSQTVPAPLSTGTANVAGLACGSTSTCVITGSSAPGSQDIVSTSDDGAAWSTFSVPAGVGPLRKITCPTTSDCYAVTEPDISNIGPGATILASTDGGATWTAQNNPLGSEVYDISCPSATTCYAASGSNVVLVTTNGGAVWSEETFTDSSLSDIFDAISCSSTTSCVMVGSDQTHPVAYGTTNGGTTWFNENLTVGSTQLWDVACPSTSTCLAVGQASVIGTTNGGTSWSAQTLPSNFPSGFDLFSLACPTISNCYAVGVNPQGNATQAVIVATTDGGSVWTTEAVPAGVTDLSAVACASATTCEAVGGQGYNPSSAIGTTDGNTWATQSIPAYGAIPPSSYYLSGVSCPSASQCLAVGFGAAGSVLLAGPTSQTPTTTTLGLSQTAVSAGTPITYSATVAPTSGSGSPTGTVTFEINSSPVCTATVSGGVATCTSTWEPLGNDIVAAYYSGDAAFVGSSASAGLLVGFTQTTVSASPTQTSPGASVNYSVTVTSSSGVGTPTGSVTMSVGSDVLCTVVLTSGSGSGSGSCSSSATPVGQDEVVATYSGDPSFLSSSGEALEIVGPTTTAVSAGTTSTTFGTSVTYSATVTSNFGAGTPTGSVNVEAGGDFVCTVTLVAGSGSCSSNLAPGGNDTVSGHYSGDTSFAPSSATSSSTLDVATASTTVTPSVSASPVGLGTDVVFRVLVAPAAGVTPPVGPQGSVAFLTPNGSGFTTLCTTTIAGLSGTTSDGSCSYVASTLGSFTVTAAYSGDGNFTVSAGQTGLVVLPATTTTVTVLPASTTYGQSVTYSATVQPVVGSGTPTGSVTFTDGSGPLCVAALSSGTASCASTAAPVGNDAITGSYGGSSQYGPSAGSAGLSVAAIPTTTAVHLTPPSGPIGTVVTFSATVAETSGSSTPTGSVSFTNETTGTSVCSAVLSGGTGSCSAEMLRYSESVISGAYSGDATNAPSSGTADWFGSGAVSTTTISVTPASTSLGDSVTYSATVTSGVMTPTGDVLFGVGTQNLCTAVLINGSGSCTSTGAPWGVDTVTGLYEGDSFNATSSSTTTLSVGPFPSMTLSKSAALVGNQVVTVTGTGWNFESSATFYECTTKTLTASCTGMLDTTTPRPAPAPSGTISTALAVIAGPIDNYGDTCGIAGSPACYLVAVGSTGYTVVRPIAFALQSIALTKTLVANSVDKLSAINFPIGDTVEAVECDSSVTVATVSQHCEAATAVTGVANGKGVVAGAAWGSVGGLTIVADGQFADSAGGSCNVGGMCAVMLIAHTRSSLAVRSTISLLAPTVTPAKTLSVLGNYVETVAGKYFPSGDIVEAEQCDSTATVANVATHCDPTTASTATTTAAGAASMHVPMLVDAAYSDAAGGTCKGGSSCFIEVVDTSNPQVTLLSHAIVMALPTVTISPTTVVGTGTRLVTVTAKNFPIGDTVHAVECDSAFTQAGSSVAANCDASTPAAISGVAATNGVVVFSPSQLTVLTTTTSPAYSDTAGGTCINGGPACFVATTDLANAGIAFTSAFVVR